MAKYKRFRSYGSRPPIIFLIVDPVLERPGPGVIGQLALGFGEPLVIYGSLGVVLRCWSNPAVRDKEPEQDGEDSDHAEQDSHGGILAPLVGPGDWPALETSVVSVKGLLSPFEI
jgi:hypothetical protein